LATLFSNSTPDREELKIAEKKKLSEFIGENKVQESYEEITGAKEENICTDDEIFISENKKVSDNFNETLVLPENIVSTGTPESSKKKVYILQSVYKTIHEFSSDKTDIECGGILLGSYSQYSGNTDIVISAFVEAKYSKCTASTLTFTHETWNYINKIHESRYPELKIAGWIHTHPNYGIFLSEYDEFIVKNFFNQSYQTAYVIDPVRNKEGFFINTDNGIRMLGGFYVYDEVGVEINIFEKA